MVFPLSGVVANEFSSRLRGYRYSRSRRAPREPWLSKLSDSDVLDLAVKMRQVDEYGEIPYRALVAIGELHNLEFTETEDGTRVLTLESRKKAERIFEEMV